MSWIEDWKKRHSVSTIEDAPKKYDPGKNYSAEYFASVNNTPVNSMVVNKDDEVIKAKMDAERQNSAPVTKTTPTAAPYTAPKTAAKTGTDYLNGAFGSAWEMDPEEANKRLRRINAANGAKALGDSIMAFANSVYSGKGANSATIPKTEMPSQMQFIDRVNEARREAYNRQQTQKQYEDGLAYRNKQIEIQQQKANDAHDAMVKRNEWMDARIAELETKKDINALNAEKLQLENQLRIETNPLQIEKLKAQIGQINSAIAKNNTTADAAVYRAETDRMDKLADKVTTNDLDYNGKVKSSTTHKVVNGGQGGKTPPSRRGGSTSADQSKTPPSRR